MITIYEGVDGTGKTTQAFKEARSNPEAIVLHNWSKPKTIIDINSETSKELLLIENVSDDLIFDRSFIFSEYIYAKVLGRKTELTLDNLKVFVSLLNRKNAVVKLLYFTDINSLKAKANAEDNKLPLEELNTAYIQLMLKELSINNLVLEEIDRRG